MNQLAEYLDELSTLISQQDKHNQAISQSNVGWHIEHILLTINMIINEVKKASPEKYKWSFKLPRILVFSMNRIPRGRAKSPTIVLPTTYDKHTLLGHIKLTQTTIHELANISQEQYFHHPFFGHLKLKKTIKFLEIHTNHHLEIIHDIIRSND